MLITAGSIQHGSVFRQDIESRARSGSILELIGTVNTSVRFSSNTFKLLGGAGGLLLLSAYFLLVLVISYFCCLLTCSLSPD